jgi:hypothetical protein
MKIAALVRVAAPALAAAVLAYGCTPADATDPFAQICSDYASAYCQYIQTCSKTAIQIRFGSADVCVAQFKASCLITAGLPHTGVTAGWQTACTNALPTWSCPDFLFSENPPPDCQVAVGSLPNGAACAVRSQCQSGFCAAPVGAACGTCGPPPAAGDPCSDTGCAAGYRCVGTPPACEANAMLGGACGQGIPCTSGLLCSGSTSTTMGTCQPAPDTVNAPCTLSPGCDIDQGLACNVMSDTCQTVRISLPRGPCNVVDDQEASCQAGSCIHGTCLANPLLGAPCSLTGASCITPAHCVVEDGGTTGTCQIRGQTACN